MIPDVTFADKSAQTELTGKQIDELISSSRKRMPDVPTEELDTRAKKLPKATPEYF